MSEALTAPGGTEAPAGNEWLPESYRADPAFQNFKSVDDLAGSYKSAASMVGMDKGRVLALPNGTDPTAWGQVWDKLGRPANVADYGIQAEGDDGALWQRALPAMHKLGLTKAQVQGLHEMMGAFGNEYAANMSDPGKLVDAFLPKLATAIASEQFADMQASYLKQAWGAAFDEKMHAANKAAGMFASADPDIAKMFQAPEQGGLGLGNLPGVIKLMAAIGERLAEPGGLTGGGGSNQGRAMTPTEAANAIGEMKNDPEFRKLLMSGDREANAKWASANAALQAGA